MIKRSLKKFNFLILIILILGSGFSQNSRLAARAAGDGPFDTRNVITTLFWGIVAFSFFRVLKKEFSQKNTTEHLYTKNDSSSLAYQYIFSFTDDVAFDTLKSESERQAYIDSFWQDFDPGRFGSGESLRNEYESRVEYANENFGEMLKKGWRTDRGRIHIIYGNPQEIIYHPVLNDGVLRTMGEKWSDIEVWYYQRPKGRNRVPAIFHLLDDGRMFFVFTSPLSSYKYEQVFSTEITEKSVIYDY